MNATYFRLASDKLQILIDAVLESGFRLVAPSVSQSAVVYQNITNVSELPRSFSDSQAPGQYRLQQAQHQRYFYWTNTVQSLKPILFKPRQLLWSANAENGEVSFHDAMATDNTPIAVLGPRACDLAALKLQDQHFLSSSCVDPGYATQRANLLIIAVDCAQSASTCFCVSTGDGPGVSDYADIALSELDNGFLLRGLSDTGIQLLGKLRLDAADQAQLTQAEEQLNCAAQQQQRRMPDKLDGATFSQEKGGWEWLEQHCLSCGNCTLVCPSCYCHNEYDENDLIAQQSRHYRQWSSCFTEQHSYMHGIVVRKTTALRYKQWITHKLVHWIQQYGRSGCVGCGRCITWCPVGIDITETAINFAHNSGAD